MKKYLTGSTAIALVVGFGVAVSSPASAFDKVHWEWDKHKHETVWTNKWTWGWFTPNGETQIQEIQLFVGDVESKVKLRGDYTPVVIEGDTVTVSLDEDVDVAVNYEDEQPGNTNETANNPITSVDFNGSNPGTAGDLTLSHEPNTGTVNEITEGATFTMNISGEFEVEVDPSQVANLDANTQMGHAVQNASAAGVIGTINSSVPIPSHEGQYVMGDINAFCDSECDPGQMAEAVASLGLIDNGSSDFSFSGNRMHDIGALLVLGRALGLVEKSEITATASAGSQWGWWNESSGGNPVELAVDQSVTAVAAQLGVTLEAEASASVIDSQGNADAGLPSLGDTVDLTPSGNSSTGPSNWFATYRPKDTDLILENDITQVGFADVKAKASAYQDLRSYVNLGEYTGLDPDRPGLVANQNAVAAGLIKSINVSVQAPAPAVPETP